MRALRLEGGALRMAELPVPEPGPDEALVRVERSGICNTDLELARGYMAFEGTLGHEFCGTVERAGDRALVGRRVAGEINLYCGTCDRCRAGARSHCPARTVLGILGRDGAHAGYLTLPERNLHVLPPEIPVEAAVLVEPLAACCRILEQRPVARGERVAVIGDGKLGFLAAQVLLTAAGDVRVIGRHGDKMRMFEGLGIPAGSAGEFEGAADLVVECSGSPGGLDLASRIVRPEGTIVLKTTCAQPVPLDTARVVVNEVTVIGSRCGPFDRAVALLRAGRIRVGPLIEATLPLSRGLEAMERAGAPGARKILLDPAA